MTITDLPGALPGVTGPIHHLSVDDLLPGDSPRTGGEDADHVNRLAETEQPLPPIIVDRSTRRVIDGMHRLSAARLRGDHTIEVVYFSGDREDAFALAVRENTSHGLPLSRADRQAAAARIAQAHPSWSDRIIAAISGVAAKTVRRLRSQSASRDDAGDDQATRIGRDGRARPVDPAAHRRRISDAIAENPDASLRQIARITGASPATVRSVRRCLASAEDQRNVIHEVATPVDRPQHTADQHTSLDDLTRHPALRPSEGVALLQWLTECDHSLTVADSMVAAIPVHSTYLLARVARSMADTYAAFADNLDSV